MPIAFANKDDTTLPWQKPISPQDRVKGRTEELDESIDACWVGDRYQKMSPVVAGQVLKWRLQMAKDKKAEDAKAKEVAALDKLAKAAVAKESEEPPAPKATSKSQAKREKTMKEKPDA